MNGRRRPSRPRSGRDAGRRASSPTQPCPSCTISSQTVATSPSNRARNRIGVGEEVDLTVSPGPATWAITSGGGTLSPASGSQTTVTFTAGDTAGSVTIRATGAGCSCDIPFTVVEPSSWTMMRRPGSGLRHTQGRPNCGWQGSMYVHPNDVNFYRVETREVDSLSIATGSYNPSHHGQYHGSYPPPDRVSEWFPITRHSESAGSTDGSVDDIYSGFPGTRAAGSAPPFNVGSYYWPITMQWRVVGSTAVHNFPGVRQKHEIYADGRCESRKGGHTEHCMYNDPTSTY